MQLRTLKRMGMLYPPNPNTGVFTAEAVDKTDHVVENRFRVSLTRYRTDPTPWWSAPPIKEDTSGNKQPYQPFQPLYFSSDNTSR